MKSKRRAAKKVLGFGLYFGALTGYGYSIYEDSKEVVFSNAHAEQEAEMKVFQDYILQIPHIIDDLQQRYDEQETLELEILQQLSIPCIDLVTGNGYSKDASIKDVLSAGSCELDARQTEFIRNEYVQTVADRDRLGSYVARLTDTEEEVSNVNKIQLFATNPESTDYRRADLVYILNGEYTTRTVDRPNMDYSKSEIIFRRWNTFGMVAILFTAGLLVLRVTESEGYKVYAQEKEAKKDTKRFKKQLADVEIGTVLDKIIESAEKEKWGEG